MLRYVALVDGSISVSTDSIRREEPTYNLEHVPVEDVVVRESLPVEKVPEQLPEVGVVGLVVESERSTEVQIRRHLRCSCANLNAKLSSK